MEGLNLIQTSFMPTEIMSTYLLAFVVSEFKSISPKAKADVLVIIYYISSYEAKCLYCCITVIPILPSFDLPGTRNKIFFRINDEL